VNFSLRTLITLSIVANIATADEKTAPSAPQLRDITVASSLDGTKQHSMLWTPESATSQATPLYVHLHSWSGGYKQDNSAWLKEAASRGWIFLHPDFRGRNDRPQACGSKFARQDILDAISHIIAKYKVEERRVYLAGVSGGGHMTMLMSAYYPERFSATSAWVGISDLAEWYRFHTPDGKRGRYAQMTFQSCGGAPGDSDKADAAYHARSPLFYLHRVGDLPIDLNAGVNDGHTGSVPIAHTLKAFNAIAKAGQHARVSETEIVQLSKARRLTKPGKTDTGMDPLYGREIRLRRVAGKARVTIFDGGHEGIAKAGMAWLEKHQRETRAPATPKAAK
jgi:poly(3-hydroxybutyrate) depolymerase